MEIRNLRNKIKTLGGFITDLVFPVCCIICGKEVGVFLCGNCQTKLPKLEHQKCIVCAKPSAFGKTHPTCVNRNTADGLICSLPYADPKVDNLIRIFKYKFISGLGRTLGQLICEEIGKQNLNDYFSDFKVVPVPLHKRRFAWRGFNQALLLGQIIADQLSIPINEKIILRTRNTKPQVKLAREERKANITDAFALNPETPVAGRKFLLVDDVVTSGSTMNEIARLLKKNKAAEVWAIAVAHG